MIAMFSGSRACIGVIDLIIVIALAFWPARVASREGHGWRPFFICSLFFFLSVLIVASMTPYRRLV